MRVLLGLGVVVLIACAGVAYYLTTRLDALVADAIETQGAELVGTRVSVGGVSIDLAEGKGTIRELRVANPKGFSARDVFLLDSISLDLDVASLASEPIVIDSLTIAAPSALFEVDAKGGTNIQALAANLEEGSTKGGTSAGGPIKLRIRRFVFEQGHVALDPTALGRKESRAELPALKLNDLGGRSGATPEAIGDEVLKQFGKSVAAVAAARGVERLITEKLGDAEGKAVQGLLQRLRGGGER